MFKKILLIIVVISLMFSNIEARQSGSGIGVRNSVFGHGEFYTLNNGKSFYPRGNNYQEFDTNIKVVNFNVGLYNSIESDQVLSKMQYYGYNSVRVVFSTNFSMNEDRTAISNEYLNNFKDFVLLAKNRGIYVEVVSGFLPNNSVYYPLNTSENFEPYSYNQYILDPDFLYYKSMYMQDLMNSLTSISFPFDNILGWEIENEPYFDLSKKPFTLTTTILASDGNYYSMINQKSLMVDNAIVNYMNTVRSVIKSVVPNLLVTMTVSSPGQNNPVGRYITTQKLLNNSDMDYISINLYPNATSLTTDQDFLSFGISNQIKPIHISEFGAYPIKHSPIQSAIDLFKNFQVKMCNQYNVRGFMFYDWDASEIDSYLRLYHAVEQGEQIAIAMSPLYRKSPCLYQPTLISGKVESVSAKGEVTGWVVDPEATVPIKVNFWENGILRGTVSIRFNRLDIRNLYEWNILEEGFYWKPPYSLLSDGATHTIYVWAADKNIDGTFGSYQLQGSPIVLPKFP